MDLSILYAANSTNLNKDVDKNAVIPALETTQPHRQPNKY